MNRVFVPNRGEIAVRIVRACHELGLEAVVGASEVDLEGLAARLADRTVCIGPGSAGESYLRDDVVVQAALGTGCDAVHPGYGFLSESPRLAARAREHGLIFVGPPLEVIELSGDKLRARAKAAAAGLPVLPGGEARSAQEAAELAGEIGYPVLLKAAGGGGGRGIKQVHEAAELTAGFGLAAAEARAAFGDERLYVEGLVGAARHLEVQVAGDERGRVVHLGERDCSVQQRHQKVVEEAPAPALSQPTREALRAAAVDLARDIGYGNLGTVEFVLDAATDEFFFLEINCRIQVEHPVTEAVTGIDLVREQLQIADGRPLSFTDVEFEGHAIECRLTAESPGRLSRFALPDLANLRVDTHCAPGALVPPHYDPLLAKLIGHGEDREEAVDVLREAIDGLEVEGVDTNKALLASVLAHPDFERGAVTTRWLEEAVV